MNKKKKPTLINIGTGKDFTIEHYAKLIAKTILPQKKIIIKYDFTKPNGIKKKVMDISLAKKCGWKHKIDLKKSILDTYQSYIKESKAR
jgi:GDP-L-fucose synthase